MSVTNRAKSQHYRWGQGCDGWRLVDDPALTVIEEEMPAGAAELQHVHAHAHQAFYVLEGQLSITVDDAVMELAPGDALHIPPSKVHKVRNVSASTARFLVVSSPSTREDRVDLEDSSPDSL